MRFRTFWILLAPCIQFGKFSQMHYVFINNVMFVSIAVDEGCNVSITYVLAFHVYRPMRFS